MTELSLNTRAILLLTAPLIAGREAVSSDLLSPGEYKRLARCLRELQREPSDLLDPAAVNWLRECGLTIAEDRLLRLLGRGFLLSQVVERWQARAIWVVSRADAGYPRRLKTRLREDAPALIYGCGDRSVCGNGGLAIVGSRHADEALLAYASAAGRLAAEAGRAVVSGGAAGIDRAAMRGALEAGGQACGVLADGLEKVAMHRENRNFLLEGKLLLISPYDPSAGFHVGNAMQRNKLVYALADASLVVSSDRNRGGTWTGASEQLDKLGFVPVFVRSAGEPSEGLEALLQKGALPWPEPRNAEAMAAVLGEQTAAMSASAQAGLPLAKGGEPHTAVPHIAQPSPLARMDEGPAEALFGSVRAAVRQLLRRPMKDSEVARGLDVSKAQAKAWLDRLVAEGVVEKRTKPSEYALGQTSLFE